MLSALALIVAQAAAPAAQPRDSARGTVVTDSLWSQALGIHKKVVVYLPPSYARSPARRYPVAYYLHGLWGRETDWTAQGALHVVMDSLVATGTREMLVVMPDGDDGWYTTWNALPAYDACRRAPPPREPADTYCVPWPHYDDYIARDVVQFIDKSYRTEARRDRRAIAGLSMGGYGAISLGVQYADVFSAAASHSGVLAPLYNGAHPFDGKAVFATSTAELEKGWGPRFWPLMHPPFGRDTASWWARDPMRRIERLVTRRGLGAVPALFADVGTEDGLADESRVFKFLAGEKRVPLTYHEWPGKHDWPYWRAHVGESLRWIAERIAR